MLLCCSVLSSAFRFSMSTLQDIESGHYWVWFPQATDYPRYVLTFSWKSSVSDIKPLVQSLPLNTATWNFPTPNSRILRLCFPEAIARRIHGLSLSRKVILNRRWFCSVLSCEFGNVTWKSKTWGLAWIIYQKNVHGSDICGLCLEMYRCSGYESFLSLSPYTKSMTCYSAYIMSQIYDATNLCQACS